MMNPLYKRLSLWGHPLVPSLRRQAYRNLENGVIAKKVRRKMRYSDQVTDSYLFYKDLVQQLVEKIQ